MKRQICMVFFLVLAFSLPAFAVDVPPALKQWEPWVLYGHEDQACPFAYNNWQNRQCVWPTELVLDLGDRGGSFTMKVRIYDDSWIFLPGDKKNWPQEIRLDGKPWPVANRNDRPSFLLPRGDYEILGRFVWQILPESLPLPEDVGVVRLTLKGKVLEFPDVRNSIVWLKKQGPEVTAEEDRIEISVYRRIIDDVPIQINTRLELDIAGKQREEVVGPVLPLVEGGKFIPLRIDSPLPARLDDDGLLHLQVRPGHWEVQVHSRSGENVTALPVPKPGDPWPAEEVWVYESRPALRVTEPGGLPSIDPRQTNLPKQWQQLPAFLGKPGGILTLKVLRRGDVDPAPDNLSLTRDLWLDFKGTGYTVNDRITGTMSRTHRLEAGEDLLLGRVAVNGENRLITKREGSPYHGVEVRRGRIMAQAESRIEEAIYNLYATGWTHDFQSVSTNLKIPPGWDVLTVMGTDNRPRTWLQRWTLLDLFIVLVVSISLFRLFGPAAGITAVIALGLSWHAPYAPRYIWLHLIIAWALVRYLPKGRLYQWARGYRIVSLVVLAFLVVPFTIDQVRSAIFPQLEYSRVVHIPSRSIVGEQVVVPQVQYKGEVEVREEVSGVESVPTEGRILSGDKISGYQYLDSFGPRFDQRANVQTGPGLPEWQWKNIDLSWNGPVKADQKLHIVYVPPALNSIVKIVRVLLVLLLGLLFLDLHLFPFPIKTAGAVMIILALAVPRTARAEQFPAPDMLHELQTRLLKPAQCLPDCAQVSRMSLDADPEVLRLHLELHVLEKVAVPLPGTASQWLPEVILVDGSEAKALMRDEQGFMWIAVEEGIHRILLEGPVPRRNSVQVPLGLPVQRVDAHVSGWTLDGVHENGVADEQLQLTRINREDEMAVRDFETGSLPPFVFVERNLILGLEWRTRTLVRRFSPTGSAVVLEVPLLSGESVITDGIRVSDGKVMVNLGPQEHTAVWDCALDKTKQILLSSPQSTHWTELWRVEISPMWHMKQTGGIAVVHKPDPELEWAPEWRPWPGEGVELEITRPEAIEGNTLTIDSSLMRVMPGKRATDAHLVFRARSSLGGQHVIALPEGAELTSVKIDDQLQPIRQEAGKLTLPLHPGKQTFEIAWRMASGMGNMFTTPALDLGIPSVNHGIHVRVPQARWILFTGGLRLGPAVLFWGVLLVVLLLSIGLGRAKLAPLNWWQWTLLGVGLTQASLFGAFIIVFWLIALGLRRRLTDKTEAVWHNLAQIGLAILTFAAFMSLIGAVRQGLLGSPSMQILGNGSYGYQLQWFADRVGSETTLAWILSVPLFVYRLLMLAWALWLASALIGWVKWGWQSISVGGYWKQTAPLIIVPRGKRKKEEKETDEDQIR